MKKAGQSSGRADRSITSEEAELWEQATRTLVRVKTKARVAAASSSPAPSAQASKPRQQQARPGRTGGAKEVAPALPVAAPVAAPDALNRRQMRRIAAGRTDIDDRIDLHGLRQAEAHARLRSFLARAYAGGAKTVLVITGKGGEAERLDPLSAMGEGQRGVLRRNVPLWLAQGELRHIVLSYSPAGTRHGGAGAFYVRLRKSTRSP